MMDADRRIEPAGRVRYAAPAGTHHHPIACRQCAAPAQPQGRAADDRARSVNGGSR